MNDTELNELLNQWEVPPTSTSFRENARAEFCERVGYKETSGSLVRWLAELTYLRKKALLAGTVLVAAGFFLLLVTQAFAQTLGIISPLFRIPYVVDSEVVEYSDQGAARVVKHSTSYSDNGKEIELWSSLPGDSFGTAIRRTLDVAGFVLYKLTGSPAPGHPDFIRAGCTNGPTVKRETIFGFATTVVEQMMGTHRKITYWMSPDLGCFALRIRLEEQRADGSYRVVSEKRALKVTLNP